jgi:hypothetical protein
MEFCSEIAARTAGMDRSMPSRDCDGMGAHGVDV